MTDLCDAIAVNLNVEQHDRLLDLVSLAPMGLPCDCLDRTGQAALCELESCGVVCLVGHDYRLTPRGIRVASLIR